ESDDTEVYEGPAQARRSGNPPDQGRTGEKTEVAEDRDGRDGRTTPARATDPAGGTEKGWSGERQACSRDDEGEQRDGPMRGRGAGRGGGRRAGRGRDPGDGHAGRHRRRRDPLGTEAACGHRGSEEAGAEAADGRARVECAFQEERTPCFQAVLDEKGKSKDA